ncbi:MAG: integrin alpha, partial [Bacteroidota bacterium]
MYAVRSLLLATLTLALVSPAFAQVVSAPVPTEADLVAVPGFPASGLPGQTSNDEFGTSVAGAGDVNGDGYADLIVGAPENDAGGLNSGRAYVYFGGPGSGVTPDLILTGETSGDNFGAAVASAGDVNGDGYDDVIVGAPESNGRGLNAGRAYVYFGGPTADAIADVIIAGSFLDQLGTSVSGAGDVNGDGFADVIVGVPFDDVGASNSGRARVYFGGPSMDAFADLTLTGTTENGNLGASVSGAGDVNGDGFADVIVGETGGGTTNEGRAYVFFGGSSADAVADLTLVGESMGDLFGESVSGAGDMNGDGFTDVIVGARNNDAGAGNAGRAYVFFGGTAPDAIADLVLTGTGTTDQLGDSVSGAGDVNGDSYDDVIIGVPFDDDGGINSGGAHVYFGGPVPDAVADLVLTGVADFDDFGVAVAGAGDLDGDGLADLAIGAPEADPNGASSGAAYVFSNANSGAGIAEWEAFGGASGDRFGAAVASAGDVNGDGYDDVIVGAPEYASSRGRAYVFYGGPGADAVPDVVLTGNALGDEFGRSVSGAGDVNGDGYDDVIVGAPLSDLEATDSGRANIYFGGPSMNATEDVVLTRDRGNARFGKSVSGAGDVNGDGYADVIVGSPTNTDLTSSSLAYVYFGGRTMNAEEDVVVRRLDFPIGTRFAEVVSDAGDVNGDGFGDMLVGEPGFGRAYVYFGGVTPDGVVDVTLTEESGVSFGSTVSGTGDVNGDGYADLVVGAPGNDAASSNDGRAYVYFGGAAFDGGADIVLTGPVNADSLGASVSGAGDVNGDGYADVIVGAPGADQGLPGTGQAYVYYGGRGGDGAPDLVFSGTGELEDLGRSVSGAGDFNGDGRADVIVGAPGNDTEGGDAGAAFVYRVTGPASSPGLFRLADVPGDQGGLLQARWTRSDQETLGNASSYLIERSEPAGVSGYAWEPVATVSASGRARYSLAVPTYSDQTGTNPGTTCVQVTAQGDSGETWRSMVSCGASIDNLSPAAPSSLALTQSPDGDVALTWDEVTGEPDLFGYDVFQSSTEACDATATLVGTAEGETTVTFEDDATAFGT